MRGLLQSPGQRPGSWAHWAALGSSTPWRFLSRLPPRPVGRASSIFQGRPVVFRCSWLPGGGFSLQRSGSQRGHLVHQEQRA